jgi:hypothetical protein
MRIKLKNIEFKLIREKLSQNYVDQNSILNKNLILSVNSNKADQRSHYLTSPLYLLKTFKIIIFILFKFITAR